MHYDTIGTMFFMLLFAHVLADFSLQNDFIAQAKNRHTARGQKENMWQVVLPAHGLIHGGFVFLITGSLILGLVEAVLHTLIDFLKCEGKFGFQADQVAHVLCKVIYLVVIFKGISL